MRLCADVKCLFAFANYCMLGRVRIATILLVHEYSTADRINILKEKQLDHRHRVNLVSEVQLVQTCVTYPEQM